VHPSVIQTVAKYRGRAHLIDAFISPSQPMAVLTRVTYRKFKGHFSADPSGAQPAKRPLEYPGSGKVAVVFTPRHHGMSQRRRLACRVPHAKDQTLAQGAASVSVTCRRWKMRKSDIVRDLKTSLNGASEARQRRQLGCTRRTRGPLAFSSKARAACASMEAVIVIVADHVRHRDIGRSPISAARSACLPMIP
jgi:hypothetical protein